MRRRFDLWLDPALYGASALFAAVVPAVTKVPVLQAWGRMAVWPYVAAAFVAAAVSLSRRRPGERTRLRLRAGLAAAVLVGVVLVPLAVEVAGRDADGPATHTKSETVITEEGGAALLHVRDPYAVRYLDGPLANWPPSVWTHVPYLPATLAFGLPRAVAGPASWNDARILLLAVALMVVFLAVRRMPFATGLRAAQLLLLPGPAALAIVGGSEDVTVLSLMLLAMQLANRKRPGAAGVAAGLAAAMKQTAWPFLLFLVLAARRESGRAPGRAGVHEARAVLAGAGAVVGAIVLPFLAWNSGAFVEDVVLFPLGLSSQHTIARSPTLGALIASALPGGARTAALIAAVAVVVVALLTYFRLRPGSAPEAALATALVMAVAIVMAPAGRFGYLLYPFELAVWSWLLSSPRFPSGRALPGNNLEPVTGSRALPARARWPGTAL